MESGNKKAVARCLLFVACAILVALYVVGWLPIRQIVSAAQNPPPTSYCLSVAFSPPDLYWYYSVTPPTPKTWRFTNFGSSYPAGTQIELDTKFICPTGYEFDYWESNDPDIDNQRNGRTVYFDINRNTTAIAHFKPRTALLTVFVDEPNPGTGQLYNLTDVGHCFWRLSGTCVSEDLQPYINTVGFYPASPAFEKDMFGNVTFYTVPGTVLDNTDHEYDSWQTYQITYDQLIAALQYTKNLSQYPPSYNPQSFNCTDALIGAASAAGVTLPNANGTVPGKFTGNCPGVLGPNLSNHNY